MPSLLVFCSEFSQFFKKNHSLLYQVQYIWFYVLCWGLWSILIWEFYSDRYGSIGVLLQAAIEFEWDHSFKILSFCQCVFLGYENQVVLGVWFMYLAVCLHINSFDQIVFFLCQYHVVCIIIALQHNLKSETVRHPAAFYCSGLFKLLWVILFFYMSWRIVL